jgi:hypothetical protein
MGNPLVGDVSFEVAGKSYTLRLGSGPLARAERGTGMKIERMLLNLDSLDVMLHLFWAGLLRKHPGLTYDEAGDLMDLLGHKNAFGIVIEALNLAIPKPEQKAEGAPQNP